MLAHIAANVWLYEMWRQLRTKLNLEHRPSKRKKGGQKIINMKITIENYRGFDIEFDTNCEKFQCIVTEEDAKESKSFSAAKKFIDDYKKDNQEFKPFYVVSNPQNRMYREKKRLKIIGIRKDGRFMAETKSGDKIQISDYDLKDYILEVETNERFFTLLEQFDAEQKIFLKEHKDKVEKVYNNMQLVTLKKYKQNLIG